MMMTQKMKLFVSVALLVLVAFMVVVGVVAVQKKQEAQRIEQQEKIAREEREKATKAYEDLLNGFVKDVAQEMKTYKVQRGVLREIVKPHNYSSPDYAKQNYEEFKNQISADLRKQAQRVLNVFDVSGAKLDQILEGKPDDTKATLKQKWAEMRDQEYAHYKTYFDTEDKVLQAYEELLRFYFVKSKSYKIENDEFIYTNPEDKMSSDEFLKIIAGLQVKPEEKKAQEEPQTQKAVQP